MLAFKMLRLFVDLALCGLMIICLLPMANCGFDENDEYKTKNDTNFVQAWKLHVGIIKKLFDLDHIVEKYVNECFYLVGRDNWLKYPDHLCNYMSFYPDQVPQDKVNTEYRKLLKLQRSDEHVAIECFVNKFRENYEPCKGLTWDKPAKLNPRERMKVAFFERLQREYFMVRNGAICCLQSLKLTNTFSSSL